MPLDKEVYTLLGIAMGAAATGWATLVGTRAQARLAQTNMERDRDRQAAEHAHLVRARLLDRGLDRLEPAYVSLAAISRRLSLTGLTVHETAERDVRALDALYDELGTRLDDVTMTLGLYAADAHLSTAALSAAMNRYWGSARDRLRLWQVAAPAVPDSRSVSDVNDRLLDAAEAIAREADKLRAGILAAVSAQHAAALSEQSSGSAGRRTPMLR